MLASHTFTQSARNPGFPLSSHRVPWVQPAVHSGSRPPLSTRPRVSAGSSVWRRRGADTAVMGSHRPLRFSDFDMSLITRPTGLPHWGRTTPSSNYDPWATSCLWPFQEGAPVPWFPLVLKIGHWGSCAPDPSHLAVARACSYRPDSSSPPPRDTSPHRARRPGTRCTGCGACAGWGRRCGARRLRARLGPSAALRGAAVHRPRPWRFVPPGGSFTRKVVCPYIRVTELSGDAGTDPPGPVGFMGNGLARPCDTAGQSGLCWRPKAMSLGPVLTVLPCTPATPQPPSRGADSALGPLAGLCTWPHSPVWLDRTSTG